jgi:hypothetical protein
MEDMIEIGEKIRKLELDNFPEEKQRILADMWNRMQALPLKNQRLLEYFFQFFSFICSCGCGVSEKSCAIVWSPILFPSLSNADFRYEKASEALMRFLIFNSDSIWFDPFANDAYKDQTPITKDIKSSKKDSPKSCIPNLSRLNSRVQLRSSDDDIKNGCEKRNEKCMLTAANDLSNFEFGMQFLRFAHENMNSIKVLGEPSKIITNEEWSEKSSKWPLIHRKNTKQIYQALTHYNRLRLYGQEALEKAIIIFRYDNTVVSQANISMLRYKNFC